MRSIRLQVIHGLLDRTMQLLEVPPSETKNPHQGYHLKAFNGEYFYCHYSLKAGLHVRRKHKHKQRASISHV